MDVNENEQRGSCLKYDESGRVIIVDDNDQEIKDLKGYKKSEFILREIKKEYK